MNLSVSQFVNHLPLELQGQHTYCKLSMLEHLRDLWKHCDRSRLALQEAAEHRIRGGRVLVDHEPEDREAALAVAYAVAKLADTLPKPKKTMRAIQPSVHKKRPVRSEFRKVKCIVNGRTSWLEQYPSSVTWEQAQRFQHNPDYDLGDFTFQEASVETGETAHFDSSSRNAGFGAVFCNGEFIDSTVCWHDDPRENFDYECELLGLA
ncbi:MAG: hypothetical protein AAF708_00100 [Deinococcota bacterium]